MSYGQHRQKQGEEEDVIQGVALIPYYTTVTNRLTRLPQKKNIRTVSFTLVTIRQLMRPMKYSLGLNVPGIYKVLCTCGACYLGQTGRTVNFRTKEHQTHVRLENTEKSS